MKFLIMDSLKLMNHLRQELPIITTTSRRHKSTKIICDDEGYDNEFLNLKFTLGLCIFSIAYNSV